MVSAKMADPLHPRRSRLEWNCSHVFLNSRKIFVITHQSNADKITLKKLASGKYSCLQEDNINRQGGFPLTNLLNSQLKKIFFPTFFLVFGLTKFLFFITTRSFLLLQEDFCLAASRFSSCCKRISFHRKRILLATRKKSSYSIAKNLFTAM